VVTLGDGAVAKPLSILDRSSGSGKVRSVAHSEIRPMALARMGGAMPDGIGAALSRANGYM